jgi:IS605 OrfB family transposase
MSEVFLPTKVVDKIKEVRFVPRPKHYIMEVVYEKLINKIDNNPDILAAIDCGVNNLLIIATNQPIIQPIIINGKGIKSINRLYNKKLAEYKSKLKSGQFTSNSIINLTNKRNKRINSAIHKASSLVINYCKEYSISKIAIGYNSLWKHKVKLKSRVNQNFVQIPHLKLIEQIKYKAELIGVEVNIIEERYTSKCSALDLEPIKKNEGYVGERIYRGLFKTSTGLLINADWNGALNIGRKVFGNSFVLYLIGAKPISPKRINPI